MTKKSVVRGAPPLPAGVATGTVTRDVLQSWEAGAYAAGPRIVMVEMEDWRFVLQGVDGRRRLECCSQYVGDSTISVRINNSSSD